MTQTIHHITAAQRATIRTFAGSGLFSRRTMLKGLGAEAMPGRLEVALVAGDLFDVRELVGQHRLGAGHGAEHL